MDARALALIGFVALLAGGAVVSAAHPHAAPAVPGTLAPSVMQFAEVSSTTPAASDATGDPFILVYHIVRPSYSTDSKGVKALAQTPEVFDAQMAYLRSAGYHVVRLSDLERHLAAGAALPRKSVVLTFDDGWRDQYEYAFPILQKYGYTATFFVFTNGIGRPAFMSWSDLKTLQNAGMTIGDHSRSHPYLTKIASATKLADEITGSKALLEHELGASVAEFAYPFGQHDATTTRLVRAAGFASARGDIWNAEPSAANLYALPAMNAPTTLKAFEKLFP